MIEYIKVVSKQRPAKRAFDMRVGAHLRVYIAGKITGDANYREKFTKQSKPSPPWGIVSLTRRTSPPAWSRAIICVSALHDRLCGLCGSATGLA